MDQGSTWMEVGLVQGHIVLDGDAAPSTIFGPFFCGQTAGCIKMPLGMEVGLSPCDFVFDGAQLPPEKKGTPTPPNFWPMSIVAKWLDG